ADGSGNVYVADSGGGKILRVSATGSVTTVLDHLESPGGLARDGSGNLYFTETAGKRVRRLGAAGEVTGFGGEFWSAPPGIAANSAGDVWVADSGLARILHIDPAGHVTPVAGDGSLGFKGDGGAALAAQMGYPWAIATGPGETLYIADLDNNRIRLLSPGT